MSCRVSSLVAAVCAWVFTLGGLAGGALAQMPVFDFVTIGDVGNAPYTGTPGNAQDAANYGLIGRGSVNYEYRIARTELTHAQYLPFLNMLASHPDHPVIQQMNTTFGLNNGPDLLGMIQDDDYTGPGLRFRINGNVAGNWPVFGMSWRMSALYCNWLHNGAQDDPATITSGAYDMSTFNNSLDWTDQPAHSPGARYWIPTLDEWIKAAHYDPHRYGPNQGGYWLYPTRSDAAPLPGLPQNGGQAFLDIGSDNPLGMYPNFASYYGLLDAAGAASEWTETIRPPIGGFRAARYLEGGNHEFGWEFDRLDTVGSVFPFTDDHSFGLRIASAIPSPNSGMLLMAYGLWANRRCRHKTLRTSRRVGGSR